MKICLVVFEIGIGDQIEKLQNFEEFNLRFKRQNFEIILFVYQLLSRKLLKYTF